MKASGSLNVFIVILVFILLWLVVSQVLCMKLLGSSFDKLVSVGVLALIILFKEEIRRYLRTVPEVASAVDEHADRGGAGITIVTFDLS